MCADGIDLAQAGAEFGTPLQVILADRLEQRAADALVPFRAGRGADIFYSYKTDPVPEVLSRLHAAGIGAEVISAYEWWLARHLGVPGDRIVYNGPAKSDDSVRDAIRAGAHLVNANSLSECRRIIALAEHEGVSVNLGIRVSLPGMWGGQFGVSGSSPQVAEAVAEALHSPHADLRAIHVHRGGTIRTEDDWRSHVGAVFHYCDHLEQLTGWLPATIDLGGSLACATSHTIPHREFRLNRALGTDLLPPDPGTAITIRRASEVASEMATEHFVGGPVPRLIQEPGRALTADCQLLLASVVDVKDDQEPVHLVLDGGRNICDPLPHEYHQLVSATAAGASANYPYRVVGPICTPADVLFYNWRLPLTDRGDVVAVLDTGAYFVPFSTAFSFPRPAIAVIAEGRIEIARDAETFDDLSSARPHPRSRQHRAARRSVARRLSGSDHGRRDERTIAGDRRPTVGRTPRVHGRDPDVPPRATGTHCDR